MEEVKVALRTVDFQKRQVVFRQDSYDKHCQYHAELSQADFWPVLVKQALARPTFYIDSLNQKAVCYYLELFAINGIMRYVKVVVANVPEQINRETVFRIKTAFKTDHIQEQKYKHRLNYV